MKVLLYLLLYAADEDISVHYIVWGHHGIAYCTAPQQRKGKVKEANKASSDSMLYNKNFWCAQGSKEQTKNTNKKTNMDGYYGHQKEDFPKRNSVLAEPETTCLNIPEISGFRYCS